jgi:hypothetical protein
VPDGGSVFWKIVNTTGRTKDAEYIKQLTGETMRSIQQETDAQCTGIVMDGAAANRSALKQLQ